MKETKENWEKFPSDKRSKDWNRLVDILEEQFPKRKCKERGQALVLLAYAEMALKKSEREKQNWEEREDERVLSAHRAGLENGKSLAKKELADKIKTTKGIDKSTMEEILKILEEK